MATINRKWLPLILTLAIIITTGRFCLTAYAEGEKTIESVSYDPVELTADGGTITAMMQGENLFDGNGWLTPKVFCGEKYIENAINLNSINDDFDGSFTITLPANTGTADKTYTVRYFSARYDYQNPVEIPAATGGDTVLRVKGRETAMEPEITSLVYDKTVLKAAGGAVNVTVRGSALTQLSKSDLVLKNGGEVIDDSVIAVGFDATNDQNASISFELPANDSSDDQVYTFSVLRGADGLENKDQSITVKAAPTGPVVESIEYSKLFTKFYHGGNPDGGYYYLPIVLTGDNLEEISKSDFRFEVDGSEIDLDDSPEDVYDKQFYIAAADSSSAEVHIVFPANTIEEERRCSITVLCAGDDVANKVKTVTQDAKPQDPSKIFRLAVDDWRAALLDDGVIAVMIDNPAEGIELNVAPEEVKDYIYLATGPDSTGDDVRRLTDEDRVTMANNVLTIELHDKEASIPAAIVFRSGALKDSTGRYLGHRTIDGGNHYIYYHSGAHVERMSYNKVTFESGGGHVVATATGTNLDEAIPVGVYAKLFRNNESDAFQTIPNDSVQINAAGTQAVFEFDVPANSTKKTVTYRLIPVVNGFNAVPTYIKGYDVISVLPQGESTDAVTLSCIDIQGESDEDLSPEVFVTEMKPEQFTAKFDMVIRGTNLHSRKATLKAVDENGVVWPLLPVYECGATFRWQNSAMYLPEDEAVNEQHIELLIPRRLGVTRTFTFYIAPDGKNFDDDITATAVIRNEGLFDREDMRLRGFVESDFTELKAVTVKYVDESGKELAPSDTYKGYGITELYHQGIAPKDIKDYQVKSFSPSTLDMMLAQPRQLETGEFYFDDGQWFIRDLKDQDGSIKPIVYTYEKTEEAKKADAEKAEHDRYNALAAKYKPVKVRLTKAKKGSKRVTLTWKTVKKGINGYQVQITDKKTGEVIATKNIKQTKKLTKKKTINKVVKSKKLKKGKFAVRIRAYCNAEGYVFYGDWSNAKTVRMK